MASEQSYVQISLDDGLTQATINSVIQDQDGFIWIGTQDGLNRFDGYRIVTYQHDPLVESSLSHSFINKLVLDNDGILWILTASGVDRYDRLNDSFDHYPIKGHFKKEISDLYLWSMANGRKGRLWITTSNGILELDKETGIYFHHSNRNESGLQTKSTYETASFETEEDGVVEIFTTENGVYTRNSNGSLFRLHSLKKLNNLSNEPRLYCVSNVVGGVFFLCSREGLYYFDGSQFQFIANDELGISAQTNELHITKSNELWIGTVSGLYIKRLDRNSIHSSLKNTLFVALLDNNVSSIYEDKNHVMWVGTNTQGVYKILPSSRAFDHFKAQAKSDKKLSSNLITSISERKNGEVWVGDSQGGITIIEDYRSRQNFHLKDQRGKPIYHTILDIFFDENDFVWVANAFGITKLSPNGMQVAFYSLSSLPNQLNKEEKVTYATQIFLVEGEVWATGLTSGLARFDQQLDRFVSVRPLNWENNTPFADYTYTALVDNGDIWLGGYKGQLHRFDIKLQTAESFSTKDHKNHRFLISQIYGLTKVSPDRLWISGMGGMGEFKIEQGVFSHYSATSGFPVKTVYSVTSDDKGYIWSTPADKLMRINPVDGSILMFDRNIGMPIVEFSPATLHDSKGKFWLGGLNGLTTFDPLMILESRTSVKPQLTRFEFKDESSEHKAESKWNNLAIDFAKPVVLPDSIRHLRFSFASLDFSQNAGLRYRYRLTGQEELWNETDVGEPKAEYTNLPHGAFTLEISTSLDGVNWSQASKIVRFHIEPKFWQTNIFKIFVGGLIVAALYLFFFILTLQSKKKARFLEKLVGQRTEEISRLLSQRTRFLSYVSHELKTPLTLIQDPLYRIKKMNGNLQEDDRKNLQVAIRNVSKASSLIERLLRFEQEDSIRQTKLANPALIIEEASIQLSEFAKLQEVKLNLCEMENAELSISRSELEIVVYNLLSNAIKFNRKGGQVRVKCRKLNNKLVLFFINDCKNTKRAKDLLEKNFQSIEESELESGAPINNHSLKIKHGFGLPLVEQSVKILKGKFRLKPISNYGHAAVVFLPLTKVKPAPLSERQGKQVVDDDKPILIIVEDNRELRKYLEKIFSAEFNVLAFSEAESALNIAVEIVPDIIISDVMLPGINGVELCNQIKNNEATSHIPVMLLTARSDQSSVNLGLQHQATDYVTKPFNSEELILRVTNLISITRKNYQTISSRDFRDERQETHDSGDIIGQFLPTSLGEKDKQFLQRLTDSLENNFQDCAYGLDSMAAELYMSKKQISRKLKAITQKSPMEYLKDFRLEQSLRLLEEGNSLSVVAVDCGFSSQSYFSTCFKAKYKITPKKYQSQKCEYQRQRHQSLI